MKNIITYLFTFLFCAALSAQAPQLMSYQAVIRNSNNQLVANSPVSMRISILQGSASGTAVYSEIHNTTTNANGLAMISIGGGTAQSGTFANINWANGPYFVQSETDPYGGSNYSIVATSQLMSVPYALYAEKSGSPGPQGPAGPKGDKGDVGPQGPAGGGFTHYVGELYGGGVVFYVFKDASGIEHGRILCKTDLGSSQWSNVINLATSVATNEIDGLLNSNAIVSQAGHNNSAASLCLNLISDGQSDWYLPAIIELRWMLEATDLINIALSGIVGAGQIQNTLFISSTEHNLTEYLAAYRQWGDLTTQPYPKSATFPVVRAIRSY